MNYKFIILFSVFMILSFQAFTINVEELMDKYAKVKRAECVHLSGAILFLTDMNRNGVKHIKVIDLKNCMNKYRKKFTDDVATTDFSQYDMYMRENEEFASTLIYMKTNKNNNTISEILIIELSDNPSIVQLKGNINFENKDKVINYY